MKRGVRKVGWINPWIYANEILEFPNVEDGGICDVVDFSNNYVGRGYFNSKSFISIRLLSHSPEKIDKDFFARKFSKALERRKKFEGAFRLVHSEADGLSGLTVDVFGDFAVIQINTLGMEKKRSEILDAIQEIARVKGIYEKSDTFARKREGLQERTGWIRGGGEDLIRFDMNGGRYFADLKGQKTGFFLDQRFNAESIRNFSKGSVLDVFCYTGHFSINAFKGGATAVTAVDISARAQEIYEKTMVANNVRSGYTFILGNAFDILRDFERQGRRFNVVILDPPAFAKTRRHVSSALRGYKEINLRAMKILKEGGFLATATCSGAVSRENFLKVLESAAYDAHKMLRYVYFGVQSYDHPVLVGMKESEYLKFFVFEVEAIS